MVEDAAPALILEHLFLGSRAHARDRELLRRLQITHILNVTPPRTTDPAAGVPNFFEKDKSFTYRRCPIFDNKAEDILGVLEGCIAFMDQAKYYGRILVHCNKGVSRSTSMVVAYLMKIKDMSLDDALAFVTKRRSMANPNPSFRQQLQEYGQRLRRVQTSKDKSSGAVRVPRGPQGPSLPPKRHKEDSFLSTGSSIGPQLPPHLMQKEAPSQSEEEQLNGSSAVSGKGGDEKQEEEDTLNPLAISPSLPPSSSKRPQPQSGAASQSKVTIGPQLPPHLMRQEPPLPSEKMQRNGDDVQQNGGEDKDEDETHASRQDEEGEAVNPVVIGASLPPPSSKRQQPQEPESSSPRKKRKDE
uniref:protein-tyrosine-phosphatase n=1 Tax=Globisporangium ultimum (strain ATCC 200006 / CBS 805.95 / DAOM BR144) TaxID=431595 RepID=K3WZQ8_GLOUD